MNECDCRGVACRRLLRSGFTFLEALIALAIAALLVTVSARSLTMVFRADRSADRLLEGGLLLSRVAAIQYLGAESDSSLGNLSPDWRVDIESVQTGTKTEPLHWKVARCTSGELSLQIAFRQP